MRKRRAALVGYLPSGDDASFDDAGIPNLSVAVLPEKDRRTFESLYERYIKPKILPSEEEQSRLIGEIEVMRTLHGGEKDNLSSVSEESMRMLYDFLCEGFA